MKHILFFSILLTSLSAGLYTQQGRGPDKSEAVEDAKQKAVISYVNDAKNTLEVCKSLKIEQDSDQFEILTLKVSNIELMQNNQTILQAQFDIEPKDQNFKKELESFCINQRREEQEQAVWDKDVATVLSRMHYGLGGYIAGDSLGAQAFFEYNLNNYKDFSTSQSLYLTLGYDSRTKKDERTNETTYTFSAYTVGINYRYSFLKVGYDFVLGSKLDSANAQQPTSAYSWALVFPSDTFEAGVIFKYFNDSYNTGTGGIYVNFKL